MDYKKLKELQLLLADELGKGWPISSKKDESGRLRYYIDRNLAQEPHVSMPECDHKYEIVTGFAHDTLVCKLCGAKKLPQA